MQNASFAATYRSLSGQKLIDVLRLIRTLNVGPITFFQLIQRFGTAAKALEALPELSLRGGRTKALEACRREEAQAEIERAEKFGARLVLYGEPEYPKLLQTIADPPPLITIVGHPHLWQSKQSLAIVGSRNASANGCAFAQKLAKELSEDGLLIVSGLARGIDSFAHRGALACGTVGIIAGGIDNVYPPENEILFQQLRESGAIISEQPFGASPYSGAFPGRNRLIAGMSVGTLIVEASPKSGSLITAKFALEQGREVFAVPGSPLDPRARGCNGLIKDGATMVESAHDVLTALAHLRNRSLQEAGITPIEAALQDSSDAGFSPQDAQTLLEKLSYAAVNVDEVIAQTGLPPATALNILLELELAGRAQRLPGNRVTLLAEDDGAAKRA